MTMIERLKLVVTELKQALKDAINESDAADIRRELRKAEDVLAFEMLCQKEGWSK